MKRFYLLVITVLSLCIVTAQAAPQSKVVNHLGISLEGGYSHLFLGSPFTAYAPLAQPLSGGGMGAAFYYELQKNHFLFRTGLGFDWSINNNQLAVPDHLGRIEEYPSMIIHFQFDRFSEQTKYGIAYIPISFGGTWNRFFFLAGAKIGVLPFNLTTASDADVHIWAEDPDVIDPMENMPTHDLVDLSVAGQQQTLKATPINAMLSLEMGVNLIKHEQPVLPRKMTKEERYREMHRRKSAKELLQCRLSVFADYGLTDIRQYTPNPIPFGTIQQDGGLVGFGSMTDIEPYSMYNCMAFEKAKLNNFMLGMKLALQFEIQKRAPKKGSMANPFIYAYVSDQLTGKPLPNARVQLNSTKVKKQRFDRQTDQTYGRVGKSMPTGEYTLRVSKAGYFPDSLVFIHEDRFDTLFVALYPERSMRLVATDALTGRRLSAHIELYDPNGQQILSQPLDSVATSLATIVDGRKHFFVRATAEGYHDATDSVRDISDVVNLRLEPIVVRKFILQNMYFDTNKTKILPSSEEALNELYTLLSENPELRIKIIGHTDDVASEVYNQRLSEGRASSIRTEMIERGIDGSRIETEGHGETDPIVPNDSDEHRQMNRRVEIEIIEGNK